VPVRCSGFRNPLPNELTHTPPFSPLVLPSATDAKALHVLFAEGSCGFLKSVELALPAGDGGSVITVHFAAGWLRRVTLPFPFASGSDGALTFKRGLYY
jgi:hypothetical protein